MWPILINCLMIVIAVAIAIVVIRFIKVEQKGYKFLFIIYTLFWIPLMLLRQYTGTMQSGIKPSILWLPLAAYGFIGIFYRLFADYLTFLKKNRKVVIYLSLIVATITYIPIIIHPCTTTNVVQSLGVGVGASMIGTYQLLFNEQHGKSKVFLTVSLLSVPPLLADFISSAIQSVFSSINVGKEPSNLKWLWCIGLGITIITFILVLLYKEQRQNLYCDLKYKTPIKSTNQWIYYVLLCLLGSLIAFIKWANSGAIAQLHVEVLDGFYHNPKQPIDTSKPILYEGYLSLLFSLGQLAGGLVTGLILIKRIGKLWTFLIGAGIWIIYEVLGILVKNPYGYLGVHVLNGLSYGIIYNLILGFILQKTFNTKKLSPMGVYQSVMSVGIMSSSFFVSWLKRGPLNEKNYHDYFHAAEIINFSVIGAIVLAIGIFIITCKLEKTRIEFNIKK